MEARLRVFMQDKRSGRLSAQNIQFCGVCLYVGHGIYKMHEKPAKKSCKICDFAGKHVILKVYQDRLARAGKGCASATVPLRSSRTTQDEGGVRSQAENRRGCAEKEIFEAGGISEDEKHSVRLPRCCWLWSWFFSVMPTMALAEGEAKTFTKVSGRDGLTTGQYVLVVDTGYAMGEYDNGKNPWITAVEPSIANGKIENPTAGIWTLTVSNDGVIMTDAKGTSIAPKGGNNNGISKNDSYKWAASFADGKFTFAGTGEDTVKLASNTNSSNKFRGYKNETIAKAPGNYPCSFTLYKLDAAEPARESGLIAPADMQAGDTVVIFNPANGKALSTEYNGFYNKGTDVTMTDGTLTGWTNADLWTVGLNADGSFTFSTSEGKKLSMDVQYSSTPLDKANTAWNVLPAATDGCYYIQNTGRSSYLEWFADKNNWSSYGSIGNNEALFAQQIYLVVDSGEQPDPGTRTHAHARRTVQGRRADCHLQPCQHEGPLHRVFGLLQQGHRRHDDGRHAVRLDGCGRGQSASTRTAPTRSPPARARSSPWTRSSPAPRSTR